MEDFATFCKTEKHNKAIELQNSANKQTGFIASRLNRDNFWNVVFGFILFIALASGFIIPQPFGSMMFWLAFISAVVLTKHNSHLTFDKEKLEFTTSKGIKIRKSGLAFFWLLFTSALIAGAIVAIFPMANLKHSLLFQILFTFLFGIFPSLYCIIRNFPISVYFHKNAWYVEGANTHSSNSRHHKHSKPLLSLSRLRNSPINSWHSTNIYRRK